MFANRKYEELSYSKNLKMCNPILETLLKMGPHYSQYSSENATPLASYNKEEPPLPGYKLLKGSMHPQPSPRNGVLLLLLAFSLPN